MSEDRNTKFVLWFEEIGIKDVPLVGGKNASLGEMIQNLEKKGINIPGGFAITATAYRHLLKEAGIEDYIKDILKDLNTHDMENLQTRGQKVRDIIRNAEFTDVLKEEILDASYTKILQLITKLEVGSILTEDDYIDLGNRELIFFEAMMGAEAVKKLLEELDLESEIKKLVYEVINFNILLFVSDKSMRNMSSKHVLHS